MHSFVPVNLHVSIYDIGMSRRSNVCPILTDLGRPVVRNIGGIANNAIKLQCVNVGKCKACVDHITGDRCELCSPGFVGNALIRSCRK